MSKQEFMREVIKQVRFLTNHGKHKEASELYLKYFGT